MRGEGLKWILWRTGWTKCSVDQISGLVTVWLQNLGQLVLFVGHVGSTSFSWTLLRALVLSLLPWRWYGAHWYKSKVMVMTHLKLHSVLRSCEFNLRDTEPKPKQQLAVQKVTEYTEE